jgi:hypothetical protein
MFEVAATNPLEQAQKTLSLIDLANRARSAPVERALKEAQLEAAPIEALSKRLDARLKLNQVDNINIENESKRIDRLIKINQEGRAQSDQLTKQLRDLPGIFAQSPKMGELIAKELGFESVENKDGTVTLRHLAGTAGGEQKVFSIDPQGIADPQKKIELEKPFRNEWERKSAPYGVISSAFANMKKFEGDDSGSSDIGMLYSYIKMLDPGSVVREGEIALAKDTANIPQWLAAKYNKAIESGAPAFLPEQRARFVQSAQKLYDTARENTIRDGQNLAGIVTNSRLRSENVLTPAGDLGTEYFLGKKVEPSPLARDMGRGDGEVAPAGVPETTPAGLPAPREGAPPKTPAEAAVIPRPREAAAPARKARPLRVEDTLKNLFAPVRQ